MKDGWLAARAVLALPLLALSLLASPVAAVQPGEILDDPALERRARDIFRDLRCLVCRNENIDASDADLARDLRLLVRERLMAGDSDAEAVRFIVERYGEYVLLDPTASGANMILWLSGPVMLLFGAGAAALYLRRRSQQGPEALSAEERAALERILKS